MQQEKEDTYKLNYSKGYEALLSGKFQKAVNIFSELTNKPGQKDPDLYYHLGVAYFELAKQKQGQKEKCEMLNAAISAYTSALGINESHVGSYQNLAKALSLLSEEYTRIAKELALKARPKLVLAKND